MDLHDIDTQHEHVYHYSKSPTFLSLKPMGNENVVKKADLLSWVTNSKTNFAPCTIICDHWSYRSFSFKQVYNRHGCIWLCYCSVLTVHIISLKQPLSYWSMSNTGASRETYFQDPFHQKPASWSICRNCNFFSSSRLHNMRDLWKSVLIWLKSFVFIVFNYK